MATATQVKSTYVPSPIDTIKCPCCGVDAQIFLTRRDTYVAECSNQLDCDDYPLTTERATALEAATAWNNKETR